MTVGARLQPVCGTSDSIQVPTKLKQQKMVSLRQPRITDLVSRVGRELGTHLDRSARREVPGRMLTRKPVGGERKAFPDRLLNPELPSRLVSRRNDLRREIECAKR